MDFADFDKSSKKELKGENMLKAFYASGKADSQWAVANHFYTIALSQGAAFNTLSVLHFDNINFFPGRKADYLQDLLESRTNGSLAAAITGFVFSFFDLPFFFGETEIT